MPYRQLEGFIGRIFAYVPGLLATDHTTLHKRISKQDLGINIPEDDAIDSTGIKVTNRDDWMREKHRTPRREWLKVHVAVDVESNRLLPLEVTEENTSDNEILRSLLEDVNFEDALVNGAYDTNDTFEGLFSSIKRIFGETVRVASSERIISGVKRAFILCNILVSI